MNELEREFRPIATMLSLPELRLLSSKLERKVSSKDFFYTCAIFFNQSFDTVSALGEHISKFKFLIDCQVWSVPYLTIGKLLSHVMTSSWGFAFFHETISNSKCGS